MMPQLLQFDSQKLYLIFVIAVLGVIISIPIINLLSRIRRNYSVRRAQMHAVNQRKSRGQNQVFVRQTDIESNMTREERASFNEAESMIAAGNIIDAARILESIRFQRKAIDILEHHGFIDEACNVLLRLKVPLRAAVIYERNDMLEKAAHYYHAANKPEKAAVCYMNLSRRDFRFLFQAAAACGKSGDMRGQVRAEMMAMQTQKAVQKCLEHEFYDLLVEYLRDPIIARDVLNTMEEEDRKELLENIPLVPQNIQMVAGWLWIYPDYQLSTMLLDRIAMDKELAKYFWMVVPASLMEFLLQLINKQARFLSQKVLLAHAEVLRNAGYASEAAALDALIQTKSPTLVQLTETEPPKSIPFLFNDKDPKVS